MEHTKKDNNIDISLLKELVREWTIYFVNEDTGTINEHIEKEILKYKKYNDLMNKHRK